MTREELHEAAVKCEPPPESNDREPTHEEWVAMRKSDADEARRLLESAASTIEMECGEEGDTYQEIRSFLARTIRPSARTRD